MHSTSIQTFLPGLSLSMERKTLAHFSSRRADSVLFSCPGWGQNHYTPGFSPPSLFKWRQERKTLWGGGSQIHLHLPLGARKTALPALPLSHTPHLLSGPSPCVHYLPTDIQNAFINVISKAVMKNLLRKPELVNASHK